MCPEDWYSGTPVESGKSDAPMVDVQGEVIPEGGARQVELSLEDGDDSSKPVMASSQFVSSPNVKEPLW